MKNISGAEVVITGGAGFIGSNLAEKLLAEGVKITILDSMIKPYGGNMFNLSKIRSDITFIKGDIRSEKNLKNVIDGKDFVFHLAAQTGRLISMENPVLDTSINCLGTINILNVIRKQKRKPKLIFSSSRGVIGKPTYLPVDESHLENPRDIYGVNKLAAEKYCLLFGNQYDFGVTSLRLNNVYGPKCQIKSNHYGTINLFIAYALQGKILQIYGTGNQTRDYIYIADVVDAFIKSMGNKANGEIFFVGTGKGVSLIDIVDIIKEQIPSVKYEHVQFPKELKNIDFPNFYSSSNKIQKRLLWGPKIELKTGIKETIDFYKKNLSYYL
jgi:UDP-glucose 4-epimerase